MLVQVKIGAFVFAVAISIASILTILSQAGLNG